MVLPNVFRASAAAARVLADKIRSSIAPERRYVVEFRAISRVPLPIQKGGCAHICAHPVHSRVTNRCQNPALQFLQPAANKQRLAGLDNPS